MGDVRRVERELTLLVDHIGEAIFSLDPDGHVTSWNRAAQSVLGYEPDAAIGLAHAALFSREDRARGLPERELAEAAAAGRFESEGWRVTAAGERIWARVVTCPIREEERLCGYATLVRDETAVHDLRQELEGRTRALEQSNRDLEAFAGVASHDLQEPLRKLRVFSNRLKTRFQAGLPDDGAALVDRIEHTAARMQRLVDALLAYATMTRRARPLVSVNLGEVVEEVRADLQARLEASSGTIEVTTPLPTVSGEPILLHQLFQNLVGNALKFHRAEVAPVVKISAERVDGRGWILLVEDNGIGFDPKHAESIFGLLQRLHGKHEFEGSGMGLTICRRIAEAHGGTITAESEAGRGARFVVYLPSGHDEPESVS